MPTNPAVSIIVPVYNAEKTLRRCVDSVLKQEYPDFELLLVDDGSRDGSGGICNGYARQDPRVRVIHKANAGVSAARNDALDQARGTFLQFVDSDDWLAPEATKLLVRCAQETGCDMVIADFYRVSGDRVSHKGEIDETEVLSREEFAAYMMENPADYYYGVLWNKLFRREIVERHHLRMDVNVHWCEDFLFNLEYILHAKTFCALRTPIYYYVKTKGSLVSQSFTLPNVIRMKLRVFEYYNDFYKHVFDEQDYEKNRLKVYRFLVDGAGDESLLPSLKKLGDERAPLCRAAVAGQGPLSDAYRSRKLLEHYLEPAALKHDRTAEEAWLLLCLQSVDGTGTRKELADLAGVSRVTLALTLQKLAARGLLRVEEDTAETDPGGNRRLRVTLLPTVQPLLDDAAQALEDYDRTRFAGFTPQEREQYAALAEKAQGNMRRILQ